MALTPAEKRRRRNAIMLLDMAMMMAATSDESPLNITELTIAWTSSTTVDVGYNTGEIIAGDILEFQFDNVSTFDSVDLEEASETLDSGEISGGAFEAVVPPAASGLIYVRVRVRRGGQVSAWSDYDILSAAAVLLDTWADANGGLAVDFTDISGVTPFGSMQIIDGATPANDWITTSLLDPFDKLTFTRASTAYRYNSTGVLTEAASGAPRIDYDPSTLDVRGLLVEEERTNLLTYSNDASNAAWALLTSASKTANYATSPDGTSNANRAVFTTAVGDGVHNLYTTASGAGVTYTFSVWLKSNNGSSQLVRLKNTHAAVLDNFLEVTVTTSWQRFSLTVTNGGSAGSGQFGGIVNATDGVAKDILFFGGQLEIGAFATSYIPTTAATVTRIVDAVSLATTAFNHSATAGTLYSKFSPMNIAAIRRVMQIDDGTANERIVIGTNASAAGMLHVVDGGADQTAPLTSGTAVASTVERMAASWAANDFALSFDGGAAATDTSGTLPTVTTLRLGSGPSSAEVINGWIEEVMHLPIAKSDADLALIGA
jgi:hypothetical protein